MIDRAHDLPSSKEAEIQRISRGSVYYLPRPVREAGASTRCIWSSSISFSI